MISVSVACGSRILVWVDRSVAVVNFVFSPFPSHLKNKRGKNKKKKREKREWHPLVKKKKMKNGRNPKTKGRHAKTPRVFFLKKKRKNASRECNDQQEAPPSQKKKKRYSAEYIKKKKHFSHHHARWKCDRIGQCQQRRATPKKKKKT